MAEEEVKVKYSLQDNASPGIKNIVSNFSSLVAKGALVSGAITAVGYSIGKLIDAAEESRKVMAQTDAVLASTGGAAGVSAAQVVKLAESLSMMTGIDDEAIQSAENLLLTFTNIGKDVFPTATKTVLDMSVAMGQDLKSSSIQLGKALNDPIAGTTALRRIGVAFTDSQLEQIKVLQQSGDILGAQKIILAELSKEFGGSAKAAASFKDIFKVVIGNVAESIGSLFLPAINKAAEGTVKFIQTVKKFDLQEVVRWFFQGKEAAKSYREEMKRMADDAEKAGVGKQIQFKRSASFEAETKADIQKSQKIIDTYYKDLIQLKSEETLAKNMMYRKDYENQVQSLRDKISAEKSTQEESKKIFSVYQRQKFLADSKSTEKTVESYETMMAKHRVLTSQLEANGNYTVTREIANLEKIKAARNYTDQEGLALEIQINELKVKNNEETFDLILKDHKAFSNKMKINNTYTYNEEIKNLKDILKEHARTKEERYAITAMINELEVQSNQETSKKITDQAIIDLDTKKAMGDIALIYQIEQNMKILESDQLTAADRERLERNLVETKKDLQAKYGSLFISSITDLSNEEMSIKAKVARGTLNFAKQAILAELTIIAKAKAAAIIADGAAKFVSSYGISAIIAAGQLVVLGAAVATAAAGINSVKLAEGGIVMPTPGGTQATIGEAGRAEAVIPLGTPQANEMLGGGGNTRVIILDSDGKTMLAKGLYREQSRLIKTGQLAERRA